MKKNRTYGLVDSIGLLKMLKMMRFTLYFLLLTLSQAFAVSTYSQQTKLSLDMKNARVEDVIDQIEKSSEFFFMYNKGMVNVDRKVDIVVEGQLVNQILDKLFENTDVTYSIKDRQIMLINSHLQGESGEATSQQQKKTISGKVTDTSGATLPGVSVIVKGTTIGIISDNNGSYSLSNVPENAVLQFSFVGMKMQEISIGGKTIINVTLAEETVGIEEVVAIGYGTVKKSDLTGAVVSVDLGKREMAANVNLSQTLQGYVPGVNVGGAVKAGESGSLSIRGRTSLSANDTPLIILDGIIYNGGLSDIDVADIEKIDILKDASAAAVYGSRSANGVIIISTKKGKNEKPTFNFNMYYGIQEMSPNKMAHVMDANQYAVRLVDYNYYQQKLLPWYKTNPGSSEGRPIRPDITNRELVAKSLRSLEEQQNYLNGYEVDWLDLVLRRAPIQNYSLSVSGKTNKTNYYLSGSYIKQEGIVKNDNFNRVSLRANFENKITDWLAIGMNISLSKLNNSGYYNNTTSITFDGFTNPAGMTDALRASPLANVYDANGNYPLYLAGESYQKHPLLNENIDDHNISNNIFMVLSAKLDIPYVTGLKYEINYSGKYSNNIQNDFFPLSTIEGALYNNYGTKYYVEEFDWLINNILTYSRIFNERHSVNVTLLFSNEKKESESSSMVAYGFDNPILGYNALQFGKNQKLASGAWEETSISYMSRINYSYANRYLLTATLRKDGFSGFGKNNKYALFPSISIGWVASEETFFKHIDWLSYLKFRLSYGKNGNQGIGRYSSLSKVTNTSHVFGSNSYVGVYPETIGNSDLSWETTTSTNLGLDLKILNQRISAEIDVYKAITEDVLVKRTLPMASGYDNIWTNIGGIDNKGIEFGLTTINVKRPNINWESRVVFSLNRDKISKLYGGKNDSDIGNSWFVGKPISSLYNYYVDGVWQEEALFNKSIQANYYPGMYKLRDLNSDGKITPTDDRAIVGYGTPNYRFGINNTISYKNLSFSFFLNSIQGGNGYYLSNNYSAIVAGGTDFEYRVNRPGSYSYWMPNNPVKNAPAMFYSPPQIHGVYEERSFVRLQDVSFSYSFGKRTLNSLGFNSLQLFISGKNLHTWTKWSGWDPESDGTPLMRSVIGGVKFNF